MSDNRDFSYGFSVSLVGHIVLLYLLVSLGGDGNYHFGDEIVYSVTLEGSAKKGGESQVPDKKSSQVAPPKKVAEALDKVKAEEEKAEKDAEVSLAKETPTPQPTPVPTPKATPKPTPKATPKPTPKSTPKPPPPKPKATPVKKPLPKKVNIDEELQKAVQRYTGESTNAGGEGFGSVGGRQGKGFGGGELRPPAFFAYQKLLERFIRSGWRWHDPAAPLEARVCFRISPEGKLSDIALCGTSGNSQYDSSVLRAVAKADPVPAPPAEVYRFFEEVRMTFRPEA
ncbi:MAG: TonB C-terminal domain-containing protein [Bdellovibrionales bacterium]|nr:TonB C-terminal domain-containing protein [Bdellovibrionales bacterium]